MSYHLFRCGLPRHLAQRVAHGSERKNAPLATFLAGWFVAARVAAGEEAGAAWEQAARLGDELLED